MQRWANNDYSVLLTTAILVDLNSSVKAWSGCSTGDGLGRAGPGAGAGEGLCLLPPHSFVEAPKEPLSRSDHCSSTRRKHCSTLGLTGTPPPPPHHHRCCIAVSCSQSLDLSNLSRQPKAAETPTSRKCTPPPRRPKVVQGPLPRPALRPTQCQDATRRAKMGGALPKDLLMA